MNELESFLSQTAAILGTAGAITELGASRTLGAELDGRVVEVATNGPMLWLIADLQWPSFPADGTSISWAPAGTVLRIKLLEGAEQAVTGDPEFDGVFVIQGPGAEELSTVTAAARRALLESQELRPHLTGRELSFQRPAVRRRVHVRCDPDVSGGGRWPGFVPLGSGLFTPEHAARWAGELRSLVATLEGAVPSG